MIVAAPGSSSRLHGPAAELTGGLFPGLAVGHPRSLWHRAAGDTLVLCRGFDIPRLVSTGVVDIGITGYDTCVEWSLASGVGLVLRALPAARTSFVTDCRSPAGTCGPSTPNIRRSPGRGSRRGPMRGRRASFHCAAPPKG
ncbi:hypothetical protein [Micromonospora carbonacea]|uniref:ATP phosphoribosyltransferase n=1 Tax=Micromonospora carbonacea TaxID=47853 RepID=A0A1C4ZS53_9ACTN|nr:hypothetical protein [Micromonospora carbonacea]SCF35601.1 hypothetical protein GA0070563_109175 [Micromonospora carbonacea]